MRLTVQEFSCIKQADITVSPLTVLVGPQASGKSVLSKLVHFFMGLLTDQFISIEENHSLKEFKGIVSDKFKEWFPVEAWGAAQFQIEFYAGEFQVRLTRVKYNGVVNENMRVWISPFFEDSYNNALTAANGIDSVSSPTSFDRIWKVRDTFESLMRSRLGKEYFESAVFVPAGRSFFTSAGKSVMAFEESRLMDPLTMRFGRLVANLRDRYGSAEPVGMGASRVKNEWVKVFGDVMGGDLDIKRGKGFLKSKDGRKIPLSSLSSGQQELVPLLLVLRAIPRLRSRGNQMITIEEPEAHLFPSAQSSIVEALVWVQSLHRTGLTLVLTTHSPYVLAKINNLVKAHAVAMLGGSETNSRKVARVVPEHLWIAPGTLSCYSICDGVVTSSIDPDGMIDAEYLDSVSSEIAREYNRLLEIEVMS